MISKTYERRVHDILWIVVEDRAALRMPRYFSVRFLEYFGATTHICITGFKALSVRWECGTWNAGQCVVWIDIHKFYCDCLHNSAHTHEIFPQIILTECADRVPCGDGVICVLLFVCVFVCLFVCVNDKGGYVMAVHADGCV